jgi:nucleotide-binding universal stress UspA family protein
VTVDSPYPLVMVGTDGSPTATQAVRKAAVLADALGVTLLIASAYHRTRPEELGPPSKRAEMPGENWMSVGYQAAKDIAHAAQEAAQAAAPGVSLETAAPQGEPSEAILECWEGHPGALLVLGSQGMTGSKRFLLGSVPNKITHHAVADVMVVRTGDESEPSPLKRILVGTDGSKTATRAVRRAAAVAARTGASLTLLTADGDRGQGEEVLRKASEIAQELGVETDLVVREDDPASAIVEAGADHDVVIVGNRGMTGASRFLLGSVPNKVSHHMTTDLLIVKTDQD